MSQSRVLKILELEQKKCRHTSWAQTKLFSKIGQFVNFFPEVPGGPDVCISGLWWCLAGWCTTLQGCGSMFQKQIYEVMSAIKLCKTGAVLNFTQEPKIWPSIGGQNVAL